MAGATHRGVPRASMQESVQGPPAPGACVEAGRSTMMRVMDGRIPRSGTPRDDYELIDAGDGRRLERFGARIVDRPSRAAADRVNAPAAWREADLVFDPPEPGPERHPGGPAGGWLARRGDLAAWTVGLEGLTLELRPTPTGQVGVFPEHLPSLGWLESQVRDLCASGEATGGAPTAVLNLFAYTGAATLACAKAGALVAHVDSSRPAAAWARRNAALSGLGDARIRWIVEDAQTFVAREGRRGRRYQGLVLDPPSYGHGGRSRDWRLERDLPDLLRACGSILDRSRRFVLLTTHTPGQEPSALVDAVRLATGLESEAGWLDVVSAHGARLRLGAYARAGYRQGHAG